MDETRRSAAQFLDLIRRSRQGKFKIYIGMSAGVGKTCRMLQEAHALLRSGVDVRIGYVETHRRLETEALLAGLPLIPRRQLFYKGKELAVFDVQAVISIRPEVVIVDELAHSNIPGSRHEKRWQDVLSLLDAGINVISAVNIQHIESLNGIVKDITGIEVQERVPDAVIARADEVVNIDLTAEELIARLKEGKIYAPEKVAAALEHFFKEAHLLRLRELALREVAAHVERKADAVTPSAQQARRERILACISANEQTARTVIRKTAKLAAYYQCSWYVLYVQTSAESTHRIALDKQRHLINNLNLAAASGAALIRVESDHVPRTIVQQCEVHKITTVCIGKPHFNLFRLILATNVFNELLKKLSSGNIDLVILS